MSAAQRLIARSNSVILCYVRHILDVILRTMSHIGDIKRPGSEAAMLVADPNVPAGEAG